MSGKHNKYAPYIAKPHILEKNDTVTNSPSNNTKLYNKTLNILYANNTGINDIFNYERYFEISFYFGND